MSDYIPLDLTGTHNAPASLLGAAGTPLPGSTLFQGIPFQIGGSQPDSERCLTAFGTDARMEAIRVEVGRTAFNVLFAHAQLDSDVLEGGPLGEQAAEYVFHMDGGDSISVPIRERFEISCLRGSGGAPFAAFMEQTDGLQPRWEGPWSGAGRRQMESTRGGSSAFVIWVWQNPDPDKVIESIEIRPSGPPCVIGGITLGTVDEFPISREAPRQIILELGEDDVSRGPIDLEVDVDRGLATYPYPLPPGDADTFLSDPRKGWGQGHNSTNSPAYLEVAAVPSATVRVRKGDETLGELNWGELVQKGAAQVSSRLDVRVVGGGRNWVHTRVVDDATGQPVPCRVHFRSPQGIPYAPHGHHAHINSEMFTWHVDVGGDVKLGHASYAYIDGTCQGWLPRGDVLVDVARGYEYEPIRTRLEIQPGQRELELRIKRWCDMNGERWFSGDSHVHFLSAQGSHTEARGEDLNVVNLLQSQWGSLFTNTEEFTGGASVSGDGKSIVYVSQENRQHFLGHLILLGLKEPVDPWCSDGPGEAELGGTLEVTMSDWADRCHAQGGTVIIPHLPNPNGEPAALIATGRSDAVEMLRHGDFNHLEYYRYLNCGYRMPLVGGTDKMSSEVPVGIIRTYVHIPEDEPFTYESWCRHLRAGRTFLSSGPILRFTVDGRLPGETLNLSKDGGTVSISAEAESTLPIHTLELVHNGQVVAATSEKAGTRRLTLKTDLKVPANGWLCLRCGGPEYATPTQHNDSWRRGIFAHTSPVYVACGGEWEMFNADTAQYMLTLVDGCLTYIRDTSRQHRKGEVIHYHGEEDHGAVLERPFQEARAAIHRRLHRYGIPH